MNLSEPAKTIASIRILEQIQAIKQLSLMLTRSWFRSRLLLKKWTTPTQEAFTNPVIPKPTILWTNRYLSIMSAKSQDTKWLLNNKHRRMINTITGMRRVLISSTTSPTRNKTRRKEKRPSSMTRLALLFLQMISIIARASNQYKLWMRSSRVEVLV